jgi:hypothetical protein
MSRCNSLRSITRKRGASEPANRFARLQCHQAARVMRPDLNPVLLDSAGKSCVVVDAVVFQG